MFETGREPAAGRAELLVQAADQEPLEGEHGRHPDRETRQGKEQEEPGREAGPQRAGETGPPREASLFDQAGEIRPFHEGSGFST
ncbi:hypothetical protein GCM10010388_20420 [Streptomyces mauvecolor]